MIKHLIVRAAAMFSCPNLMQEIETWRFVLPIFLHVGVIHLAVNMIAQIIAGAQVEREMGTSRSSGVCVTLRYKQEQYRF